MTIYIILFISNNISIYLSLFISIYLEETHAIADNILDSDIVGSKFELHLYYYIHFWTNAPWERYVPLIPSARG